MVIQPLSVPPTEDCDWDSWVKASGFRVLGLRFRAPSSGGRSWLLDFLLFRCRHGNLRGNASDADAPAAALIE